MDLSRGDIFSNLINFGRALGKDKGGGTRSYVPRSRKKLKKEKIDREEGEKIA